MYDKNPRQQKCNSGKKIAREAICALPKGNLPRLFLFPGMADLS